jgi:hypothetical protein
VSQTAKENVWVEIRRIVLEPGQRARHVPADTREVPLEMKVKGFLSHDARIGDEVEITTPAGRRVRGLLTAVNPAYGHGFGPPIAELSTIGSELRAILKGKAT